MTPFKWKKTRFVLVPINAHQFHFTSQEIEAIKARVKEMEEEAEKLKELQGEVEKQMSTKSRELFFIAS